MKITRMFCFLIIFSMILGISAIAAYAQTSVPASSVTGDPTVSFGHGSPSPLPIIVQNFVIESPSGSSPPPPYGTGTSECVLVQGTEAPNDSPSCEFMDDINKNGTGYGITQLTFDIAGINPSTVNCSFITLGDFSMCSVTPYDDGGTAVTFYDGAIPYGTSFDLAFYGFPADTDFGGTAMLNPEPSSLVLFGSGLLAFGVILRRRRLT